MEKLTKEDVYARVAVIVTLVIIIVLAGSSCASAAYISVPNVGKIMEQARKDAKTAADELSRSNFMDKYLDFNSGTTLKDQEAEQKTEPEASQIKLFDKVVTNIENDIPNYDLNTSSLSKALTSKKGNCFTYSLYTKIACDSLEIPCSIVFATKDPTSISSGMHIWNRVTLDGTKYWVDLSNYVMGKGDNYRLSKTIPDSFKGYSNYYVLNVKEGTYKELTELKKSFTYKSDKTACSAASQTAKSGKIEYTKCESTIASKLK